MCCVGRMNDVALWVKGPMPIAIVSEAIDTNIRQERHYARGRGDGHIFLVIIESLDRKILRVIVFVIVRLARSMFLKCRRVKAKLRVMRRKNVWGNLG